MKDPMYYEDAQPDSVITPQGLVRTPSVVEMLRPDELIELVDELIDDNVNIPKWLSNSYERALDLLRREEEEIDEWSLPDGDRRGEMPW